MTELVGKGSSSSNNNDSNEDEEKKKKEEVSCVVKFRPCKDWSGEYGFDWVREGSDDYEESLMKGISNDDYMISDSPIIMESLLRKKMGEDSFKQGMGNVYRIENWITDLKNMMNNFPSMWDAFARSKGITDDDIIYIRDFSRDNDHLRQLYEEERLSTLQHLMDVEFSCDNQMDFDLKKLHKYYNHEYFKNINQNGSFDKIEKGSFDKDNLYEYNYIPYHVSRVGYRANQHQYGKGIWVREHYEYIDPYNGDLGSKAVEEINESIRDKFQMNAFVQIDRSKRLSFLTKTDSGKIEEGKKAEMPVYRDYPIGKKIKISNNDNTVFYQDVNDRDHHRWEMRVSEFMVKHLSQQIKLKLKGMDYTPTNVGFLLDDSEIIRSEFRFAFIDPKTLLDKRIPFKKIELRIGNRFYVLEFLNLYFKHKEYKYVHAKVSEENKMKLDAIFLNGEFNEVKNLGLIESGKEWIPFKSKEIQQTNIFQIFDLLKFRFFDTDPVDINFLDTDKMHIDILAEKDYIDDVYVDIIRPTYLDFVDMQIDKDNTDQFTWKGKIVNTWFDDYRHTFEVEDVNGEDYFVPILSSAISDSKRTKFKFRGLMDAPKTSDVTQNEIDLVLKIDGDKLPKKLLLKSDCKVLKFKESNGIEYEVSLNGKKEIPLTLVLNKSCDRKCSQCNNGYEPIHYHNVGEYYQRFEPRITAYPLVEDKPLNNGVGFLDAEICSNLIYDKLFIVKVIETRDNTVIPIEGKCKFEGLEEQKKALLNCLNQAGIANVTFEERKLHIPASELNQFLDQNGILLVGLKSDEIRQMLLNKANSLNMKFGNSTVFFMLDQEFDRGSAVANNNIVLVSNYMSKMRIFSYLMSHELLHTFGRGHSFQRIEGERAFKNEFCFKRASTTNMMDYVFNNYSSHKDQWDDMRIRAEQVHN